MRPDYETRVGILDLPGEILIHITSYLQHPGIYQDRIDMDTEELLSIHDHSKAIQSLRLACRTFNKLASPLLFPIVRVHLDEASVDFVQNLLQNPLLSAGVRRIQVHQSYRFESVVRDKTVFLRFAMSRAMLQFGLHHHQRRRFTFLLGPAQRELLWERILACITACERQIGGQPARHREMYPDLKDDEELILQYEKLLDEAFEVCQRKRAEHWRVVSQRLLVNALGNLAGRAGHPISLSIVPDGSETVYGQDPPLFSDPGSEDVLQYMTVGQSWYDLKRESFYGPDVAIQTQIALDLPISIYRKGGSIHALEVHHVLVTREHAIVCEDRLSSAECAEWVDFRAVCQDLESFKLHQLGFNGLVDNAYPPLFKSPHPRGMSISQYLGSASSGPRLKRVDLNACFPMSKLIWGRDRLPLAPELANLALTSPTVLKLGNISMTQEELELLCQGLSSESTCVDLDDIFLSQGSWAPVLDMLRAKLEERCTRGECVFGMRDLSGGETAQLRSEIDDLCANHSSDQFPFTDASSKVDRVFTKYVVGDGVSQNPTLSGESFRSHVVKCIQDDKVYYTARAAELAKIPYMSVQLL